MWYQLNISELDKDSLTSISEQLEELGALSITFTDKQDTPIFEPELNSTPLWQQTVLTALYDEPDLMKASEQWLKSTWPQAKVAREQFEDKVWEREWLKSFKPMAFGKRLWICPTHYQPPQPDAVNIMLDPGLAFGTGTHQTTALCLSFLDGYSLNNQTVCDYGMGSGILAISALKLGAKHAYGVDIDPQAVIATRQNAQLNGIKESELIVGLVDEVEIPQVDLVMANILAGPLIELAPVLVSKVKAGGVLVLSGLLATQVAEISQAYQPYASSIDTQIKDEWALCHMKIL